jgi:uroporphyrin-III C-methyltransferase/precorrin-2 dehydrogenase/sirohydrochlorin ferrochelatase
VLIAIGTGGVSAGLAAALRQRLEALLPAGLGQLAERLQAARPALRRRYPDGGERRRALGAAMAAGAPLDPLGGDGDVDGWLASDQPRAVGHVRIVLTSPDPDDLTLRQARLLANADRVLHHPSVPTAILDRARADAVRQPWRGDAAAIAGLTLELDMA